MNKNDSECADERGLDSTDHVNIKLIRPWMVLSQSTCGCFFPGARR